MSWSCNAVSVFRKFAQKIARGCAALRWAVPA